jgi:GDP/UDP-N,N'-diacetylbacillosamine 2-epimerase (hydrolysing)
MRLKSKKILIFTTNRSDYGLLKKFIYLCKNSKYLKPTLVVSGSHLEKKFGYTLSEIKEDNLIEYEKAFLNFSSDTPRDYCKVIARGFEIFSRIILKKKPDLIVVLGDRIELIPICYSALLFNIPIAHFNGGELTEGAVDDSIRHSISKISHVHFVANEVYRKRLIKMGEDPKRVFNVGGTSVDNIKSYNLLNSNTLKNKFNLIYGKKNFLVTYHPVTLDIKRSITEIQNLLKVLNKYKDYGIIFTGTNIDPNNNAIRSKILNFCKKNKNVSYVESFGHKNYLSLMKFSNVIIGNSSSGILEAPYLKKPVVNIGNRQGGRVKSKNIISCKSSYLSILKAVEKADSLQFLKKIKNLKTFYGDGNASFKATKILEKINLKNILIKKFYE